MFSEISNYRINLMVKTVKSTQFFKKNLQETKNYLTTYFDENSSEGANNRN